MIQDKDNICVRDCIHKEYITDAHQRTLIRLCTRELMALAEQTPGYINLLAVGRMAIRG